MGYYLIDDVALNVEAIGYFVDHSRSSGAGGIDLLARWHYLSRDPWSLYVEGGGGFIYSDNTLREPGTHFNFTVQGGAGTTYQFVNGHAAMLGIRWFHISNARIRGKERNVGFDSPMFYVGLMTLF